ncbi:MAG: DUF928 domain-containing protein [Spirulina sp. SIO3F2]|nr:DUF928 domain-containing protein [Spirulina sp. SIO3F2]
MHLKILRKTALSAGIAICFAAGLAATPTLAQNQSNRGEFPGRRVGGGTRSDHCEANSQSLVALNPVNNLGITASNAPTLYFALPNLDRNYVVNFVLEDASQEDVANRIVYQTTVEAQKGERFLSIPLFKNTSVENFENTLVENKNYQWFFFLVCNPNDIEEDVILSGWLRQVSTEMSIETITDSLDEQLAQVEAYQASGLWSDAIAAMVPLYQNNPNESSVRTAWAELLDTLKLQQFVKPIVALDN